MTLEQLKSELSTLAEQYGVGKGGLAEIAACTTQEEMDRLLIEYGQWLVGRLPLAELQQLTPMLFENLACLVREAVAKNRTCPADLLVELSDDPKNFVRKAVAQNRYCPVDLLKKLADDTNADVREAVALNSNCPADTLAKLSEDIIYNVRRAVARNPFCPTVLLIKLGDDPNEYVRWAVAQQPRRL